MSNSDNRYYQSLTKNDARVGMAVLIIIVVAVCWLVYYARSRSRNSLNVPSTENDNRRSADLCRLEMHFMRRLEDAFGDSYVIVAKQKLSHVLRLTSSMDLDDAELDETIVDFVAYSRDESDLIKIIVIQLDLDENYRELYDVISDGLIMAAGIPVCHFLGGKNYTKEEIREAILVAIEQVYYSLPSPRGGEIESAEFQYNV